MRTVRFSKDGSTSYGILTGDRIEEIKGEPWVDATPTGKTFALGRRQTGNPGRAAHVLCRRYQLRRAHPRNGA